MVKRIIDIPSQRSFFLFGARQTGKSTLINQLFQNDVWKVDLLQTDEYAKYSKNPHQFRLDAVLKIDKESVRHIIIDEVQKIPELLNEVHYLLENYSCQFILLGSSARKLKRSGANLLAGRALQRHLFPFSFQEIKDRYDLDNIIRYGSLPPLIDASTADKIEILSSYTQTYLREEIQMEGLVRNLGGFYRFLEVAGSECGELLNFSNVARECRLPVRTVQSYYEILEDTLIGFRLQPWLKSMRKRLVAHPKFYLFDLGVTNSINKRLLASPDTRLYGRLFEQLVILETFRQIQYARTEVNMYFWRTNHGAEVDLILERHQKIMAAIEIKSTSEISGAELSGLRSFREDNPEVPLYVISRTSQPFSLDGVSVVPWQQYLEQLDELIAPE